MATRNEIVKEEAHWAGSTKELEFYKFADSLSKSEARMLMSLGGHTKWQWSYLMNRSRYEQEYK